MSDFVSNIKSTSVGAISSFVVGLPTVGIFVPKVFYFLMEFEASNYWVYLFLLLYLVSPILLYWLAQKMLMIDGSAKSIFPDKYSGFGIILLLAGFLAYCSIQTKHTFNQWTDANELNEALNDTINQRMHILDLEEMSEKVGFKPTKKAVMHSKLIIHGSTTYYELPKINKAVYQQLLRHVNKNYDIRSEAYSNKIAPYLKWIQVAGIGLFSIIIVLLIIRIVHLRKEISALDKDKDKDEDRDEDTEPLKLRMGIQEGVLFTAVLLLFPLINPITDTIHKPSEVIQLTNWDPTNYYNESNNTSYRTYVTHYGEENIFHVDSASQSLGSDVGVAGGPNTAGNRYDVGNADDTFKVTLTNDEAQYLKQLQQINHSLENFSASQGKFSRDFNRFVEGLIRARVIRDISEDSTRKKDPS